MTKVLQFHCPNCGQSYEADASAGVEIECHKCAFRFVPSGEVVNKQDSAGAAARVDLSGPVVRQARTLESLAGLFYWQAKMGAWVAALAAVIVGLIAQSVWAGLEVGGFFTGLAVALAVLGRLAGIHASIIRLRADAMRREK